MSPRRRTAKRATAKRARAKRATAKRAPAKRKPARKPKRRAVAKPKRRAVAKPKRRGAAKPKRAVARKPPPKQTRTSARTRPAPPPAFPQMLAGSAKEILLFRMVKARASVAAAIQALDAAKANEPLAPDKWSTRETVLHLVTRDRARLREMEAALRGVQPSWTGLDPVKQSQINELDMGPLRPLSWEEAVRLLHSTRQLLLEAVESIPEEPAEIWDAPHPFGWMFQRLPDHDIHHADIIKRWRTERGA